MAALLVESVHEGEVVDGERLFAAAAPELEDEVAGLPVGVGEGLHEQHLTDLDGNLAQHLLSAQELNERDAVLVLLQVPVEVLLVKEGGVGRAGAKDAVRGRFSQRQNR